jgi:integrase
MSLYRRSNGYYYIAVKGPDGRRAYRSTKRRTRSEAFGVLPEILREIQGGPGTSPADLLLELDAFLSSLRGLGRSPVYLKNLECKLKPFAAEPSKAQDLLNLKAESCSDLTISGAITMIRGFGAWLEEQDQPNPFQKIKCPSRRTGPTRTPGQITQEALARLLACDAIPLARRLAYSFCAMTGLRKGEASRVKPDHFREDPDMGFIVLIPAASAKSRVEQRVPISEEAWRRFRAAAPFDVAKRQAEQLRADFAKAGLPTEDPNGNRISFHSLRHYFVSAITRVADLGAAQALARHAGATTTNRYIHTDASKLRNSVELAFSNDFLPSGENHK